MPRGGVQEHLSDLRGRCGDESELQTGNIASCLYIRAMSILFFFSFFCRVLRVGVITAPLQRGEN